MTGNFWEYQRELSTVLAYQSAGELGRSMKERWTAKREAKRMDEKVRAQYVEALASAKRTGEMPAAFQAQVPIDELGRQTGIKAVVLRELAKKAPSHPLVVSKKCREVVGTVTLINYNRANRPIADNGFVDYAQFAPEEEKAEEIFQAFPKG